MDFTISTYRRLVSSFKENGYLFVTFSEFLTSRKNENDKLIIMRHDVDEQAQNALKMASVEHGLGIKATYYFRIVKQSNKPDIIKKIAAMGHEIGYHYEDLSTANGNYELAIKSFEEHLHYFRTYYPVKTVCMHGSSTSKYDNRLLWSKFKLEDYNLIGEPYLSLDFTKTYYLTDTGYAWDGGKYATRDVVENKFGLTFHFTNDIIYCIRKKEFPCQAMILAHTLWTDNLFNWTFLHIREIARNHIKQIAVHNKYIGYLYKRMVSAYWGIKK